MFETVAWISIIVGFVLVISMSLAAMLLTRRREREAPPAVDFDEAVKKVDAAADAALNELNKTAELILKDMDEKYSKLLFLYDLLEEKQKKTAAVAEAKPAKKVANTPVREETPVAFKKSLALNAKNERIMELRDKGMSIPDIAKELSIGKGEIKLVIDLMER